MRTYGQVKTVFWKDRKVRELSLDAAYIFQYLLTSDHSNAIGLFRLPMGYAFGDLEPWLKSFERVSKGFDELIEKGFVTYCEETNYVLIHNYLRHNEVQNPKVAKFCLRLIYDAAEAPENLPLVQRVISFIERENPKHFSAVQKDFDTLCKGFRKGIDTLSIEQKNERFENHSSGSFK